MADLTIIMPTYNKAKYVAEALDSVFRQRTSYAFDVVVADDCSTDGTLDVVERYVMSHPGVIRVLRSDRNLKLFRNVARAYADLRTPYFCVLDPDDFWSSDRIVQEALDFLSSHPDFTIYSSNCRVLEQDGKEHPYLPLDAAVDSTFESWMDGRGAIGQTAGLFYRNVVFANGLPERLRGTLRPDQERTFRGDGFRNFVHLHEGRAHFDPRQSATYRITSEGLWQGLSEFERENVNLQLFLNLDEYFDYGDSALFGFICGRFAAIRENLPHLMASAGRVGGECLESYRLCRRRFAERHAAARRFAAGLSVRNRLRYWLWRRLNARAARKGWEDFACR